jgi:hypothetical protein
MDTTTMEETTRSNTPTMIAGGCLAGLCLFLVAISALLGYQQNVKRNAATATPALSPTPHILVQAPAQKSSVKYEDFSSNGKDWGLYYAFGKIQVIQGKLILQSYLKDGFAIGLSDPFQPAHSGYRLQADFSTDVDVDSAYGLIFGMNASQGTYYTFGIWPKDGNFQLFKYNGEIWTELVADSSAKITHYPQVNTLGIACDQGQIEMYINGERVAGYSDADFFQSTDVGVFVDNAGFRLIVDDFFIY